MRRKRSVSVQILDQVFHINTDASAERVEKIAHFLTENLQTILSKSKVPSPYYAAVLAALNITEKYFEALERQELLLKNFKEQSEKVLGLLENIEPLRETPGDKQETSNPYAETTL